MSTLQCSAPGKLFLGGEYAVLTGAPAIVMAVDRRAVAAPVSGDVDQSVMITSVSEKVSTHFDQDSDSGPLPPIRVSTPGFSIGRKKIGLGSSAAVCASVCGALFEYLGRAIDDHRAEILSVATDAHRAAQGGKGSGADVAAAVLGGTLLFTRSKRPVHISLSGLTVVPIWSGRAASTSDLIQRVEAFGKRDPAAHRHCFERLSEGAAALAEAYRTKHGSDIIAETAHYYTLMEALGTAADVTIVTKEHALAHRLAADLGGSAKPSGAGGGDTAIAVFDNPSAAVQFRAACLRFELTTLDLAPDNVGLRREP